MVAKPNNPPEKVRELQHKLYRAAKYQQERLYHEVLKSGRLTICRNRGAETITWEHACRLRRSSVSRMREIRKYGLNGGPRKRSGSATAPEAYQWTKTRNYGGDCGSATGFAS